MSVDLDKMFNHLTVAMMNEEFRQKNEQKNEKNKTSQPEQSPIKDKNQSSLFAEALVVTMNIMVATALIVLCAFGLNVLCDYLWDFLTPGQKWLELTLVLICLLFVVLLTFIIVALSDTLDEQVSKMTDELKKRDAYIEQLEERLNKRG